MGNFWAFIQHLESSFKDIHCGDCGFKDSCEPLPPPVTETDMRKGFYDMYENVVEEYRKAWENGEVKIKQLEDQITDMATEEEHLQNKIELLEEEIK